MQAAGNLVAVAPELPARVELRQDDGQCRQAALLGHGADRDARAVVAHGHRIVRMKGHLDAPGTACQGLVDRVVDHLIDEVVEPPRARRADVHARAQPDRLEAFEHSDVFSGVSSFSH